MPRKAKRDKRKIELLVNGRLVTVTMFPPTGAKRSWYVYWTGLKARKSTGHTDFDNAVAAATDMLRNGGQKSQQADTLLSDEEFEEIQRRHYAKKTDTAAVVRAEKSLASCLDAIRAFREITGITPISLATPEDCEQFQREALKKPRNWRMQFRAKDEPRRLRPNTVIKWSVSLQAAFERANSNAGKKCVRGVVPKEKLLKSNPWREFTWIDGTAPTKRIFSDEELLSILDELETKWGGVPIAGLIAKVSLWIWARKAEVAGLKWDNLHVLGDEHHFDFIGKWGIRKWARIPPQLYAELLRSKTDSPFVFGGFPRELRRHFMKTRPGMEKAVNTEYSPDALGWWFNQKLEAWAKATKRDHASHHSFRKTALQFARIGDDRNEAVALDARISRNVMVRHYVDDNDEMLRLRSNRTFYRLVAGLPPEVARRYSFQPDSDALGLEVRLYAAASVQDWKTVGDIAQQLLAGKQKA